MTRLFGIFCLHEWEEIGRGNIVGAVSGRIAGEAVELRCKHCGDIKWRKLWA